MSRRPNRVQREGMHRRLLQQEQQRNEQLSRNFQEMRQIVDLAAALCDELRRDLARLEPASFNKEHAARVVLKDAPPGSLESATETLALANHRLTLLRGLLAGDESGMTVASITAALGRSS